MLEVITKLPSTITLSQSTSAELLKSVVIFTAKITSGSMTPTGNVVFMNGTTVLGSAAMGTSGSATFATDSMAVGSHQITAIYSGDGSSNGSLTLPITNTVDDFTNIATGATTQEIFPGGSTSYSFTLTPTGEDKFLNDVSLSVTGLPAGTTYSFSKPTIAAGSGATTVTLNLKTSSALSAQVRRPSGMLPRSLPMTLAIVGLVGVGTIRRHRRQMPRLVMLLLLSVASLLPIASLTGCAGGYFALTPNTYNLSVTGAEGTLQHTATATLIVQ